MNAVAAMSSHSPPPKDGDCGAFVESARSNCRRFTALLVSGMLLAAQPAAADEGGVSFWLPGQQGSLAAAPGEPGWSLPVVYYHADQDAGGDRAFPIGGRIAAGVRARADMVFIAPAYVFARPMAGGQAAIGVTALLGHLDVEASTTLTGPGGATMTMGESDSRTGVGDLFPTASLKWNHRNHNFLVYTMAGVPVGAYTEGRLANLGTNHWSLDAGVGYTYLDPAKGRESSAVLGFTHNWENPATDYRNGASAHLDWATSQFFSEQLHVGLAGYLYQQLGGDSGDGAVLGDFKSRVAGIGPQVGYLFPIDGNSAYFNARGYYEFNAENRPKGWNVYVTLAIPLGASRRMN